MGSGSPWEPEGLQWAAVRAPFDPWLWQDARGVLPSQTVPDPALRGAMRSGGVFGPVYPHGSLRPRGQRPKQQWQRRPCRGEAVQWPLGALRPAEDPGLLPPLECPTCPVTEGEAGSTRTLRSRESKQQEGGRSGCPPRSGPGDPGLQLWVGRALPRASQCSLLPVSFISVAPAPCPCLAMARSCRASLLSGPGPRPSVAGQTQAPRRLLMPGPRASLSLSLPTQPAEQGPALLTARPWSG